MVRFSTVWMDPTMSRKYLIFGDQFVWFVTMINHYLINPNQVRALNISVHDDIFNTIFFGIETDEAFTPLTSKGTVIRFEVRVPTSLEEINLPAILLTGEWWYSMNV